MSYRVVVGVLLLSVVYNMAVSLVLHVGMLLVWMLVAMVSMVVLL